MSELSEYAVNLLMDGRIEEAEEVMLVESTEGDLRRQIGEVSYLDYLLKFSKYLDDHDVQIFEGWDDALLYRPEIRQFWVIIYMRVGEKTDLKAIRRICTDKEDQNEVRVKKMDDGTQLLRFKILRRLL